MSGDRFVVEDHQFVVEDQPVRRRGPYSRRLGWHRRPRITVVSPRRHDHLPGLPANLHPVATPEVLLRQVSRCAYRRRRDAARPAVAVPKSQPRRPITVLAQSAIDRLTSAAHELVIEGESYRRRQKPGGVGAGRAEPTRRPRRPRKRIVKLTCAICARTHDPAANPDHEPVTTNLPQHRPAHSADTTAAAPRTMDR